MTVDVDIRDTALVVVDPQNDVLHEDGVSWALVGDSVSEMGTVKNIGRLFQAAKEVDLATLVSPHFLYDYDQSWLLSGVVERSMLETREFHRSDPSHVNTSDGDPASQVFGADWLEQYKKFIEDGRTVVCSPHKAWGPQTNDLVFQLGKRRLKKVVLAGMLANLCLESHLRDLVECGIEVAVVKDATAAPRHPDIGDGYIAALINYGFIANAVLSTTQAEEALRWGHIPGP